MADADDDVLTTMSVLVIVCSLLLRRRRAQKARRRRFWVHPCWRYRDVEGQANVLLPRLRARDEGFFRDFLRMPPSSFDTLLHLVRPVIERQDTPFRQSISAHDRLAMTVRFLANGDTMRSLSFNFLTGRSTAGMIVRETCAALWEILQPIYVRFPQTAEEWKKIATDMLVDWNFPNCIGCIDGKHVSIECPANSGSRNLNYKKSFSTVLMATCDAHYRFVYVDVGHYGGESDGGVFLRTKLMRILGERRFGIPPAATVGSAGLIPYLMVGDEAFPLKPYLMRPYPRRALHAYRVSQYSEYLKRAVFNYRLSRARRLIENSFGILASRWRILKRPFRASEETTENIVRACVALHNFLMKDSVFARTTYNPPGFVDHEDWEGNVTNGAWRNDSSALPGWTDQGYHSARAALEVRDRLASYFMSDGQVPWQESVVTRAGRQEM
ncbi:uncharacterized protein [Dermacentor andersoni]|uniref:uncharacterized protein isoform X2 n=1 Tax=Dermacentor andersoni TaxID=34620 RepID=UPI002416A5ED|nr:uncharacterized protein LOC126536800 [Dermacentor andersoni]